MKLKNQEDYSLWFKLGECVMEHVRIYICMYVNAVANSVTLQLYLRYDFHNIISKIKHKLYIASGSPHLPIQNSGCTPHASTLLMRELTYNTSPLNTKTTDAVQKPIFFILWLCAYY
jgi:hypothetical protein